MHFRKNRNSLIRGYIWSNFLILLSLSWRTIASVYMALLGIGAAAGQAGEPHQWFIYFTALMLFFCPWGSPVRNAFIEEYRQRKMERMGIDWFISIRYQSCLTSILLIWADIYINGVFGIILGWRYLLKLIFDFNDNTKRIVKLWKMN